MRESRTTQLETGPAMDGAWTDIPNAPSGRNRNAPVIPSRNGRGAELVDSLSGMAATIGEVDPRAAERMQELADAMATEAGRASWSDVDLRRAFQTDRIAYAYAVRRQGGPASGSIAVADKVRNVLVLVPILLTWFALSEASRAYARYIERVPDDVRQPFLLLWERGFGGEASPLAPTFSAVALMDAVLIGLIVALTLYAHGRREDHEDKIAAVANGFQTDLDNMLAESSVTLARDRASRPATLARAVERLAERFERSSQELLTRLRVEHDRLEQLASRREREFADFGVFASGMRAGAEETHRLLVELRAVSSGLQSALDDLTTEVSVTADQGRTLLVAIQSLERLTTSNVQSDQALTRQMTVAAETLASAAERGLANAEAAAQAARVTTETSRGLGDLAQNLVRGQLRLEEVVTHGSETNGRLADALRGSAGGVLSASQTLQDVEKALVAMREGFSNVAAHSADQVQAMRSILSEQESLATGLTEVARDLGSISVATAQRQEASSRDLASLIGRIDELTGALARSANGNPALPAATAAGGSSRESGRPDPNSLWPRRPGQ